MNVFSASNLRSLALGLALGVVMSSAGWAQILGNGPIGSNSRVTGSRSSGAGTKPVVPEPEAIPGSKARTAPVPATRVMGDMPPTDALFDAINRGDIAAARDSLNRGADLNGVNILGMTPMELSVDLGRNDISFLLLSMRGEDSGRGSRAVGRDIAAAPVRRTAQGDQSQASVVNAQGQTRQRQASHGQGVSSATAEKPVAGKSVAMPKLFANDGGTAVPGAGFLGFDSRPVAN